jgi:hypothetical protein
MVPRAMQEMVARIYPIYKQVISAVSLSRHVCQHSTCVDFGAAQSTSDWPTRRWSSAVSTVVQVAQHRHLHTTSTTALPPPPHLTFAQGVTRGWVHHNCTLTANGTLDIELLPRSLDQLAIYRTPPDTEINQPPLRIGWSVNRPLSERPAGVMAGTSTIA